MSRSELAKPIPLWQEGIRSRALENKGARARLALVRMLDKCGQKVSLVEVHTWPSHVQGKAYLWALSWLDGNENIPPPWLGP